MQERARRTNWIVVVAVIVVLPALSALLVLNFLYYNLPAPRASSAFSLSPDQRQELLQASGCRSESPKGDPMRIYLSAWNKSRMEGCDRIILDAARHHFVNERRTEPSSLEEALMAMRMANELSEKSILNVYLESLPPERIAEWLPSSDNTSLLSVTGEQPDISLLIRETRELLGGSMPQPAMSMTSVASVQSVASVSPKTPAIQTKKRKAGKAAASKRSAKTARKQEVAMPLALLSGAEAEAIREEESLSASSEKPRPWKRFKSWVRRSWKKFRAPDPETAEAPDSPEAVSSEAAAVSE